MPPSSNVGSEALRINPTMKFIKLGYGLAALGAILLVAILALTPISIWISVIVGLGALQRLLNFGDIVIDNASEDGGKLIIKNIDSPREYADKLLSHMRRLEK